MGTINLLVILQLILAIVYCAPPAALLDVHIWPLPKSLKTGNNKIYVNNKDLKFSYNYDNDNLKSAIERYRSLIFHHSSKEPVNGINEINIIINNKSEKYEELIANESYSINIPIDSKKITIESETLYGFYHALETLSQIIEYSYNENLYLAKAGPYQIYDEPVYSYRLLLIDTSRHYIPKAFIYHIIDSMTYTKLNVLHWHMIDAEAIPIQSRIFPDFWNGSFTEQERYTFDEIEDISNYARARGIRIVPEVDEPDHSNAMCVGYPNLCPTPTCRRPLDPTKEETFDFFDKLIGEMNTIFPDQFFHIGGDEVNPDCWENTPRVVQWMKDHNFTTSDTYYYFVNRIIQIVKSKGKTPVVWEEVFNNFASKLDKDTVIHVWLADHKLDKVVNAGFRALLSNAHPWYLPQPHPWNDFYNNPITYGVPEEKQHLIVGGGPAMWGEWVDPSDFWNSVYPRAAAAAEVVWTPQQLLNVTTAENRLRWFRCHLHRRGVGAGPVTGSGPRITPPGPGSCYSQ